MSETYGWQDPIPTLALPSTGLILWALKCYNIEVGELKDGEISQKMRRWEGQRWSKNPSRMRRINGIDQVQGREYKNTRKGKLRPSWSKWPSTRKEIFFLMRPERKRQNLAGGKVILEGGARIPSEHLLSQLSQRPSQSSMVKVEVLE